MGLWSRWAGACLLLHLLHPTTQNTWEGSAYETTGSSSLCPCGWSISDVYESHTDNKWDPHGQNILKHHSSNKVRNSSVSGYLPPEDP